MIEVVGDDTKNSPLYSKVMHRVSSQQTSPRDDLDLSVRVTYNKKTQFPINSVKKACRMYYCQVFYHKEGFNNWKATLEFYPIKKVSKYNIVRQVHV